MYISKPFYLFIFDGSSVFFKPDALPPLVILALQSAMIPSWNPAAMTGPLLLIAGSSIIIIFSRNGQR